MPTLALGIVLTLPVLICGLSKEAWNGLRWGTANTHFGRRSGLLARVYGVFYLSAVAFLLVAWRYFLTLLIETGAAALTRSLLEAFRLPYYMAIFLIAFGGLMYLYTN
jgi:hypothetical protein